MWGSISHPGKNRGRFFPTSLGRPSEGCCVGQARCRRTLPVFLRFLPPDTLGEGRGPQVTSARGSSKGACLGRGEGGGGQYSESPCRACVSKAGASFPLVQGQPAPPQGEGSPPTAVTGRASAKLPRGGRGAGRRQRRRTHTR